MSDFWRPSANFAAKQIILTGKVQGVGCRAQVLELVLGIGHIHGFVKNLDDGNVEICIKGDDWRIDSLIDILKNKMYKPVEVKSVEIKDLNESEIKALQIKPGFVIKR